MLLYSIVAWLLMGIIFNQQLWPCCTIFIVSTYLMVELNNRNSLLRTYSRMVSCSFIALAMMLPALYQSFEVPLFQLFFIAFFSLSFTTYQHRDHQGIIYASFLTIGLASLFWPPILYSLPVLWIVCAVFLMSMNLKGFFASLFAVLTPYWCLLPAIFYFDRFDDLITHFEKLIPGTDIIEIFYNPESLLTREWDVEALPSYIPLVLLIIISLVAITHYFRKSYQDKIQTRMYFFCFITLSIICIIAIPLVIFLPFDSASHLHYLTAMFLVCTAPLVGHYITFTSTRLTNVSFVLFFIIIIIQTVMQSIYV